MRIRYSFGPTVKVFESRASEVILGRPRDGLVPDIDLTPDRLVSRPHARITYRNGCYYVTDLASANGTRIDEDRIPAHTEILVEPGQTIGISNTNLTIIEDFDADLTLLPEGTIAPSELLIDQIIDAAGVVFDDDNPVPADRVQHIARLYELPLRFAADDIDRLLQGMIEELVAMLPSASRGAVLVSDPDSAQLLLKAHIPTDQPSVSMTLARRAIGRKQGFIWSRSQSPSKSQIANSIESGIYVPLVFKDTVVGVACVDNSDQGDAFSIDDLRLVMTAAHHAALAVTQNRSQAELRQSAVLLGRLLTNFSPKTRDHLLNRARHGRLRLGGERSEVVILVSDIRGFTRLTETMEADEVVDLLNDYFSVLVDAIFAHDGTIDKYVGDSILAVFGSPEPDEERHEKAVSAALAMQSAATAIRASRQRRGLKVCEIGIGLHCGPVLHGFIGSPDRMELTVIGDVVNRASRYCEAAGSSEILMSVALYQHVWRVVDTERKSISTKEGALTAHRVRGLR